MDLSQLKQALDTFANKYFCPPKLKFSHLPSIPEGYLIRVPSSRCCWEFSLSSLPLRQGDKHMLPKLSSSLVPPSAHLLPEAHLTFNPLGILLSGMGHLFHLHRLLKTSPSPHLPPPRYIPLHPRGLNWGGCPNWGTSQKKGLKTCKCWHTKFNHQELTPTQGS